MSLEITFKKDNIANSNIVDNFEDTILETEYGSRAKAYFKEGYNCSQSVFLAFCELYDMDIDKALRLSSSFGGGMGRLREVCGAVTGMFMVAGMLYGYSDPKASTEKKEHYQRIQDLAKVFEEENSSIVCRDLLGLGKGKDIATPEERTSEYYKKRPCADLVEMAANIMAAYIYENSKEEALL